MTDESSYREMEGNKNIAEDGNPKRGNGLENLLTPGPQKPRLLFFAGKGGVGKTVLSTATALWLAERGYRILLISTDPASHLSQVLEEEIGAEVTEIVRVTNLSAARIDQKKAVAEYKKRILDEAQEKYSPDMVAAMREELESPCTEEMAAFEKFVQYTTLPGYDIIVFDTAPTGHTLRLLELPLDWDRQLEVMVSARPGSEVYSETKVRFEKIIATLRDPNRTTFIFVVYPENTPIIEAYRASQDLLKAGISTGLVIVNQVLSREYCTSPFFRKRYETQQRYLGQIGQRFQAPVVTMPLLEEEIKGLSLLRKSATLLWEKEAEEERFTSREGEQNVRI